MRDASLLEHIPSLRRYARALTGDAADADDLVQACLERALRKRTLFRRGSLRAWLFTIMHNVHANDRRAGARRSASLAALAVVEQTRADGAEPPPFSAPELRTALAGLPVEQRSAVLLVGLEGFTCGEAAAILGVPEGTVVSRLSRGRAALRDRLEAVPRRAGGVAR
ncbi:MAG: sigma-70 family RNA polymerase sigma factor [Alphaproteobacteria bacterium]